MKIYLTTLLVFIFPLFSIGQCDTFAIRTEYHHIIKNGELSQKKVAYTQQTYCKNTLLREILYDSLTLQPIQIIYFHYNKDSTLLLMKEYFSLQNELLEYTINSYNKKKNLIKEERYKYSNSTPSFPHLIELRKTKFKGLTTITKFYDQKNNLIKTKNIEKNKDGNISSSTINFTNNDSIVSRTINYVYNENHKLNRKYLITASLDNIIDSLVYDYSYLPNGKINQINLFDKNHKLVTQTIYRYYNNSLLRHIILLNDKKEYIKQNSFKYQFLNIDFISRQPHINPKQY